MAENEEALLQQIFREDTAAWWEAFGRIVNKAGEVAEPVANYLQAKIADVRRECHSRELPCRILTLKPRQKGSTTYSAAEIYHDLRKRRTSACVIGAQYSQTQNALDIMRNYQTLDTFPWGNEGEINTEVGRWSNGSRLIQETAGDGEAGRSGTFQTLLGTEVARWASEGVKDAKKVMAGLLKCVPPLAGTLAILETTAKGASGDFYDRWLLGMDADEFLAGGELSPGDFVRVFAPWFEFHDSATKLKIKAQLAIEDTLDEDERYRGEKDLLNEFGYRDEKGVMRIGKSCSDSIMGPGGKKTGPFTAWEQLSWRRWSIDNECDKDVEVFNQDYPESWEKAFLRSGRRRFNAAGLNYQRKRVKTPRPGVLEVQDPAVMRPVWREVSREEAMLYRYEEPRVGRRYLICADTMTGASQVTGMDPDCHGVFVLRQGYFEHGRGWVPPAVVARLRPPCRWDVDILEEQVWRLAVYYGGIGGCMIVPEINADRGLVELLKLRGAMIYERQVYNQREGRVTGQLGWKTTGSSSNGGTREMAIETLARAIREHGRDGEGFDIWDDQAISECESFIVKDSGRSEAEEGHHDDDVLSLAIGLSCINSATEYSKLVEARRLPPDLDMAKGSENGRHGRAQYS